MASASSLNRSGLKLLKMRAVLAVILVLPFVVYSCDPETEYPAEDGSCCKMCGPGTRMHQNVNCKDPICLECKEGDYQDVYTKETKCKQQPICDKNLNFESQKKPSTKVFSPCRCIPNHHCSKNCISCVPNTVCQAGQRVSRPASRENDTVCDPCPEGTFSSKPSSTRCQPWTECGGSFTQNNPGSPTSDRTCAFSPRVIIIVLVVVVLVTVLTGLLCCYRKGKMGSVSLKPKLQEHCSILCIEVKTTQQPVEDKIIDVENDQPLMIVNQPQEDTEDTDKPEEPFKHGLSANGMPVLQDVSKSSLLPQTETEISSQSMSDHL